jgi:hypothetical protein
MEAGPNIRERMLASSEEGLMNSTPSLTGTDLLTRVNLIMDPFCDHFKSENPSLLITKGK